ncbi:MAG: hybrid sensor histidine kinase/response regulator [Comamonadaceae bacterium]|nr:hybrid sensor histidine kinase/response regulator [Comamonadaceae bacterium]
MCPPPPFQTPHATCAMPNTAAPLQTHKPRLLVVDDEPKQQQAVCETLTEQGYDTTGFSDPKAALQLLETDRFELLLTDLQMPDLNGIDLIRHAQVLAPDMVVILMTAHGSVDSVVDAMRNGALDYVQKPFRMGTIVPVVERALEVQRLRVNNRSLQAAVSQQLRQLRAVNQELDAFAARLAHDLRGPLVNMRSILQMVGQELDATADAPLTDMLRRGVASGDLALRMIKDLLDFARLGDEPLTLAPVALDDVLNTAMPALEPLCKGRNVQWRLGPLPAIHGHAGLLHQAFVNLLSNAIKYTAAREQAQIEVRAMLRPSGNHEISVIDNGAGFDPAHADQLFKPFRRLHSAQEFVGEGMGLANVRRIVERHGGAVEAKGRLGEGAMFTMIFPRHPLAAEPSTSSNVPERTGQ